MRRVIISPPECNIPGGSMTELVCGATLCVGVDVVWQFCGVRPLVGWSSLCCAWVFCRFCFPRGVA